MIPLISVWNGLAGRVGVRPAGKANTVFTMWVLGVNSGSTLFLLPCAILAAICVSHLGAMLKDHHNQSAFIYLAHFAASRANWATSLRQDIRKKNHRSELCQH